MIMYAGSKRSSGRIALLLFFVVPLGGLFAQSNGSPPAGAMTQAAPQGTMQGSPPPPQGSAPQNAMTASVQATLSGKVATITGDTIFVKTADGSIKTLSIAKDATIFARRPATLDSIKPGEAMGVAADRASDGTLTATVINVFPPELGTRVRMGQFPMPNGQVMTNATVDSIGGGVQGRQLLLKYAMLTATILVPDKAQIHRSTPISLGALRVGQEISARGTIGPDGVFKAANLTVDLPAP